ncbi:hypothetical protein [Thermomonas sp.]|uniref:hypothetical protein n=1 Tax=Thermomonas sp. TaxID=1971895 RepID=UPI00257FDD2D|nr:hypothetical protein [Thermomonas sp.]
MTRRFADCSIDGIVVLTSAVIAVERMPGLFQCRIPELALDVLADGQVELA